MRSDESELLSGAGIVLPSAPPPAVVANASAARPPTLTKLVYGSSASSAVGVGDAALADFLVPFVPEDGESTVGLDPLDEFELAENVAEADAWRTAGGSVEEKMAAFRTALQSTQLFLEANNGSGGSSNVPSFATTGAMESVMRLVRGDLSALRAACCLA
jgi:hypothetical protein